MTPEKIAAPSVFLLSDAAKDVTGQIFAVRMNEIFLMGQSRPIRSVHRAEGWTCRSLAEHGMPALKSSFYPLDRSGDIFSWDPDLGALHQGPRSCRSEFLPSAPIFPACAWRAAPLPRPMAGSTRP